MPGCIVSATTASFRSVEKRRLRATPVMTERNPSITGMVGNAAEQLANVPPKMPSGPIFRTSTALLRLALPSPQPSPAGTSRAKIRLLLVQLEQRPPPSACQLGCLYGLQFADTRRSSYKPSNYTPNASRLRGCIAAPWRDASHHWRFMGHHRIQTGGPTDRQAS